MTEIHGGLSTDFQGCGVGPQIIKHLAIDFACELCPSKFQTAGKTAFRSDGQSQVVLLIFPEEMGS